MTTTAQEITARLHDDGSRLATDDGRHIEDMLADAGADRETSPAEYDLIRYTLPDGSVLTVRAGAGWDLGYAGCWCWQGAGHDEECAGGRWHPSAAAAAEIGASEDPAATAIAICETAPMRGGWRS